MPVGWPAPCTSATTKLCSKEDSAAVSSVIANATESGRKLQYAKYGEIKGPILLIINDLIIGRWNRPSIHTGQCACAGDTVHFNWKHKMHQQVTHIFKRSKQEFALFLRFHNFFFLCRCLLNHCERGRN